MSETIGVIGCGLVGSALARLLLAGGYNVLGYDIAPERLRELETVGGRAATSAADVGAQCDRTIVALMTTTMVREAMFGLGGWLEGRSARTGGVPGGAVGGATGAMVIDTTTGDPTLTVALEADLHAVGVPYLDATLSGSSAQIADRRGVFMVGAREAAFAAARELLELCAERVIHVGPPGDGAKTKLAGNLVLGLNRAVLAEGLVFAQRLGLNLERFVEVLRVTPAYSAAIDAKAAKMIAGDFAPQARVAQHLKDVETMLSQAAALDQELPLTLTHRDLLRAAVAAGLGDLDNSAVIEAIRSRRLG